MYFLTLSLETFISKAATAAYASFLIVLSIVSEDVKRKAGMAMEVAAITIVAQVARTFLNQLFLCSDLGQRRAKSVRLS